MVYAQKSPEEHNTETQSIITEIENQNSIDKFKSDANVVRLLTCPRKSNQIDQAIVSNSNLYYKYLNVKNKLRKLSQQQTPASATVAVDDGSESLYKSMSLEKDIDKTELTLLEIENLYLMDELQRDVDKVRVLNCQGKSDQIDETMLSNSKVSHTHRDTKSKLKI